MAKKNNVDPAWIKAAIDRDDARRADDWARADIKGQYAGIEDHDDEVEAEGPRRTGRNRISFGPKEDYSEGLVEGLHVGNLYVNETRIGPQGTATRSRHVLFSSKDETFLLDRYDPKKGFEFRRTSKVESNLLGTRDVRYKEDGKSYDRITSYPSIGAMKRFDFDENGQATLTGFRSGMRSWFVDKEPGGLVSRTSRRELGGLHASEHRSWNIKDDDGNVVATKSMVTHRGIGSYKMSWSEKVTQDRDGNETLEHVKTQEIGKGGRLFGRKAGWLFRRTTSYNADTGQKTVTTSMFGISSKRRPEPMSPEEKTRIADRNELRDTSIESSLRAEAKVHDAGEAHDRRLKMVEAATIYRLPEPGTVRRLQSGTHTAQLVRPDFDRGRRYLSTEHHRAIGAWANSNGAAPYASILVAEKGSAQAKAGKGSVDLSERSVSETNEETLWTGKGKTDRRAARKGYGSEIDRSSSSASNSSHTEVNSSEFSEKPSRGKGKVTRTSDDSEHSFDSSLASNSSSGSRSGRRNYRDLTSEDGSIAERNKRRSTRADLDSHGSETPSESSFDSSSSGSRSTTSSRSSSADSFVTADGNKEERQRLLARDDASSYDSRSRSEGSERGR